MGDGDKQDALIRLLDSVVIKLEGGTDFDLTILDMPDAEEEAKNEEVKKKKDRDGRSNDDTRSSRDSNNGEQFDDENAALMKKAKEFLNFMDPQEEAKSDSTKKR